MINSEAHDSHRAPTEFTPLVSGTDELPYSRSASSSFISRLVFGWFTPILERGNEKKRLDPKDLEAIPLPPDCSTAEVWSAFERCWQVQLEKEHPSLFRALLSAYGYEFITAGVLKLVHDCSVFVGPQVLHALILFLRDDQASIWRGLWLTILVTFSQLIMSICLRHYFFRCYTTGLRVRSAVVVAVYRKALVLSIGERQRRSLGEITNLMSIDAQRLQSKYRTVFHSRSYAHTLSRLDDLSACHMVFSVTNQLSFVLPMGSTRCKLPWRCPRYYHYDPSYKSNIRIHGTSPVDLDEKER